MWSGTERGSMNKDELEKYKKSLPPGVLKDMQIGGKTQSPMGDLAMLGATGAAVKGAPLMIGAAKNLLKNEVSKMTVANGAYAKGILPELTRSGIKNWQHLRPWNAFLPKTPLTTGGTLQTLPTPAAGAAGALGIGGLAVNQIRKNPLGIRDAVLDKLGTPEHYKRFVQYLTGGVKGDVVTELPRNILLDVVGEHIRGAYPNRDKTISAPTKDGGTITIDNRNYNPKSTLLSTYGSGYTGSKRTLGSLGHLNFVPEKNDKGELIGYRIKDTWDVDPDPDYKAWQSPHHSDLVEGGVVAARAHDFFGKEGLNIAKPFKYDVFIPIDKFKELENEIRSKTQFQRRLETSREDKRPPHKIK